MLNVKTEVKMTGTAKWIHLLGKIKLFTNLGYLIYPALTSIFFSLPAFAMLKKTLSKDAR